MPERITAGYERLALGGIADGVRLLFADELPHDIGKLDLFNVSEIKRAKGGGMEIKFFDRFKALEKLSGGDISGNNSAEAFYQALSDAGRDSR